METDTITVRTDKGEKQVTRREVCKKLAKMTRKLRKQECDPEDHQRKILLRYPRLTAHLICQSLGYFCPRSAANAIRFYQDSRPFACEWYVSMAGGYGEKALVDVNKSQIERAYKNRQTHKGYMAEYLQGRIVIIRELHGCGPELASWF